MSGRILIVYHFFHPDTVISARLLSQLAEDLAKAGYHVTVFTCNRSIRDSQPLPVLENWNGVQIRRFVRPGFRQESNFGRLFNSAILQLKWVRFFWHLRHKFDTVIVGTDPQFVYLMLPWLKLFNRHLKVIHWVFDLYPEAILADSPFWMRILAAMTKPFTWFSYRFINEMVDIGSCMRKHLQKYHSPARTVTLTPWALAEPAELPAPDPAVREQLFGKAKLGILYSGTVGRAHDITPFIQLARKCRALGLDIAFCFAGYGNCYKEQTAQITAKDTNIRLVGFASEEDLPKRLAAADLHLVSLRPRWEGVVVPSKFFGSLAIGRPVIFSGSPESEIALWCQEYGVGSLLTDTTADELRSLLEQPRRLQMLQNRAFQVYCQHFSRACVSAGWLKLLDGSNSRK